MKKEHNFKSFSHIFICILLTVAILAIVIATGFCCVYIVKNPSSPKAGEKLLTTAAIDFVGVVITVWAALNIVNAVSRHDVEKATGKAKKLDKKLKRINKENRLVQTNLFYIELERQNDPIVHYLRNGFGEQGSDEKAEKIPIFKLTVVELKFEQVKVLHQSAYQVNKELLQIAESGAEVIKEIQDENKNLPPIVKAYLLYREAGFLFYSGYCAKTRFEGAEKFRLAAHKYEEFENQLPKDGNLDYRLAAHLNNTIGEAYSKILHYYNNEAGKGGTPLKDFFEDMGCRDKESVTKWMWECTEKAVNRCEKATEEGKKNKDSNLSTFYRNYGCAVERKKRFEGKWFDEPDVLIEIYEKSIAALAEKSTAPNDNVKNAYLVYLSYIGRCLQVRFTDNGQKKFDPAEIVRITVRPEDVDDKLKQNVNKMFQAGKLAVTDFPRSKNILVLYGFACCFALMLNDILPAASGLPEDTEFYLDEIRQSIARYTAILKAGEKESNLFRRDDLGEGDNDDMEKIKTVLAYYEGQQPCKNIHMDVHIQTP